MNTNTPPPLDSQSAAPSVQARSGWKQKLLIVSCVFFGVTGVGAASAAWWYQYNLNTPSFKPVQLSLAEQKEVAEKIAALENEPEPSDPAKTIILNEREINGYLEQQGFGETVKVNINKSGLGATILAPVDESVPLFGGRTLRLKVAFNTQLNEDKRFALSLADVSVSGISLPNAWLGNIKGLNLLDGESNGEIAGLRAFAAGVKSLNMRNGEMRLVLND
ncbi:hypothetical protein FEM03_23795 [Phragmitibacter flavus]|uniref:Uncharacterized protein n=1 Tax=Phragmitibacter flavus TaxID=2576071 RepID=A0A5R8K795_9BACT|nr:hypothetical protein [Phragmitibacter flavus]TLD68234.1 hypothetical protein FEM03_23795 [Phragmitibacter flavus]